MLKFQDSVQKIDTLCWATLMWIIWRAVSMVPAGRSLGEKGLKITRFKGLGEISPSEFGLFIGDSIRLEPVIVRGNTSVKDLLTYYMGRNTEDRQKFIIENLRIEEDEVEEGIA